MASVFMLAFYFGSSVRSDSAAEGLCLLDQLREPLSEVLLPSLLGQSARFRGHLDKLINERAQIVGHTEQHERRRLGLDRFQCLKRLRVLIAEVREIVSRFIRSGIFGRDVRHFNKLCCGFPAISERLPTFSEGVEKSLCLS